MMLRSTTILLLLTLPFVSSAKTNFLIVMADDMNWDSVGCYGSPLSDITPNIDRLAASGIRYTKAHVASTACMPSRNAINSGRYPHRSGGEGFHFFRIKDVPTIPQTLSENGYWTGIIGKVKHSTPYEDTPWDYAEEIGRNTEEFYTRTASCIDMAEKAGKPFYLIVNSHDPHRPYYKHTSAGTEPRARKDKLPNSHPSKVYMPDEVPIPEFLPDHPDTRAELADYFCSVRRFDDVLGKVLDLIKERNLVQNTVVIFLSDHGMAAPSAKSNAYLNSTQTPMIISLPGKIPAGSVYSKSFVSSLDIFPTLLDIAGIPSPGGFDGVSLLSSFQNKPLPGRDVHHTHFDMTIGKAAFYMRTVLTDKYAFTFNAFHNGKPTYSSSSLGGNFFKTMHKAGESDPYWAKRCDYILKRAPEELYDISKDPNCLNNLIDSPEHHAAADNLRQLMAKRMNTASDPVETVFSTYRNTGSVEKMHDAYLHMMETSGTLGRAPKEVKMERWLE